MSAVYPGITDWDALVRSWLPAPAAIGDSEVFAQALCWPWSIIEQGIEALAVGLADLDAADGWVVDVAGARVDEPRGGLSDTEYRRIVSGRRIAAGSLGTARHVWAVLVALAGDDSGAIVTLQADTSGVTGVSMWARVSFTPSASYLLRAGAVLRDALPLSAEGGATLATAETCIFDAGTFDAGEFGYDLPVME